MEDGSYPSPVTPSEAEAGAEDYESWTLKQKIEDLVNCDPIHGIMPKNPKYKAYFEEKFQFSENACVKNCDPLSPHVSMHTKSGWSVLFVSRDDVIEGCYVSCNHHHLQVRHDDIVEHVSSILKSNGIAHSGESIDTGKLEYYQHGGGMSIGKSDSQRVGYGETIEADKSSSDIGEILGKQPPKGSAIDEVRDMFFPYWKSVLSRRLQLKIVPSCQLSRKDLLSAEASTKGTKSMDHPCNPIKSMGNLGSMGWPPLSSFGLATMWTCLFSSNSEGFKLATNELEAFEPATNGLEAVADILRLPWEHCGLFAIRTYAGKKGI
uniref:Uncharacterized protein n=1 Tax=Oryza glumipatula TaxID=40148 RepID=A0A0E0BN53_9ORYZ